MSNSSSSSFVFQLKKPIKEYSEEEFISLFQSGRSLKWLYEKLMKEDENASKFYEIISDKIEEAPYLEEILRHEYYERGNDGVVTDYESHH